MSYDAARINELLAQLQNSSAFQSAVTPSSSLQTPTTSTNNAIQIDPSSQLSVPAQPAPVPPGNGSTVFDLLSRLNPGVASTNPPVASHPQYPRTSQTEPTVSQPDAESSTGLNVRYMTVQQALPVISKLSQRAEFRDKIKRMQDMQNQLEQSLYSDQQEVIGKHQQRVEYAQNRANIIGIPVGEQENEELASQLAADLKRFHTSRVLVAWDAQRSKQQSQMESLGVPCMFVTAEPVALQRQQKVLRILLESINESEDMS
ncbi:hypothetical protein BDV93DRAFT_274942 [Ceratobasidium sp. AG-I]|nr:hypothetical protein BDV93DRAFT_274942 [Ceratobasidium sp. AG-I]